MYKISIKKTFHQKNWIDPTTTAFFIPFRCTHQNGFFQNFLKDGVISNIIRQIFVEMKNSCIFELSIN